MKSLNPSTYVNQVQQAVDFIRGKIGDFQPEVSITLGSGLGKLSEQIKAPFSIPYSDIPNFPLLTVAGHKGEMIFGTIAEVPIVALSGRKHYYEVATEPEGMLQVIFPMHVMASLGVQTYFSTNAVGGLNKDYSVGDLIVIEDHIGLFFPNPLMGTHFNFGENYFFQPQDSIYNKHLQSLFLSSLKEVSNQPLYCGVYVAVTGRTYETAAECRFLRTTGSDIVGMSTLPEVVVAKNRGMKVLAVSLVTNKISPDGTNATSHNEVLEVLNSPTVTEKVKNAFIKFFEFYRIDYI